MAYLTIREYFSGLKDDIAVTKNFPFGVIIRRPIANAFSYRGEKGWRDYVSSGENNPIGYRGWAIWHWPYFMLNSARLYLTNGIDQIWLGGKINNHSSPLWKAGLKLLVSALAVIEFPFFLLSKVADEITGNKAPKTDHRASIELNPLIKKPAAKRSISDTTNERVMSLSSRNEKVSVVTQHAVFTKSEFTSEKLDQLKLKFHVLQAKFNPTDPASIRKMHELTQLFAHANRMQMLAKFYKGQHNVDPKSSYSKERFQKDWERLESLTTELYTAANQAAKAEPEKEKPAAEAKRESKHNFDQKH